ncbi:MAG: type II toxin-antitoxin system VapC family toxin [Pseudonocardiales bacterium]|nr:type II toxin-antitoxin system VapC family toxin [Pseudonocardiales bacterium]
MLDTNAVVLLGSLDPALLPAEPVITAITLAELSAGPLSTDDPAERAARQIRLQEVEASFDPLPFDAAAARAFGLVAAQLSSAGRRVRPRAFDALIAATAMANELPLYTCNARDFVGISGLQVVDVPHP